MSEDTLTNDWIDDWIKLDRAEVFTEASFWEAFEWGLEEYFRAADQFSYGVEDE